MPGHELRPKISQDGKLLQLRYELPHRVHTAKIYPIPSPNGSSVIVYGHERGLRILWRGGKPFKIAQKPQRADKPTVNGNAENAVILIDSDDEKPPVSPLRVDDKALFEEYEMEFDPSQPYEPIIQHLDLILNTEVLHLAFPPFPIGTTAESLSYIPPIAAQKIVMSVVCSDYSVRLITLPLIPPSTASKERPEFRDDPLLSYAGRGKWGEKMLVLSGIFGHQDVPSGVAMTFSPRDPTPFGESTIGGHKAENGRQSIVESRRHLSVKVEDWDVLLASHSAEASGMLLVYRIPIVCNTSATANDYNISTALVMPLQSQLMSSPATAISFNPSQHPSVRNCQLLVVDSVGAVRIYDCCPTSEKHGGSSDYEAVPLKRGLWLASFYPGFASPFVGGEEISLKGSLGTAPGTVSNTSRKHIVDAQWVLGGKGIMALTSDAEWGVWDIEGVGPGARRSGGLGSKIGSQGIQGGSLTKWNLSGRIDRNVSSSIRPLEDLDASSSKPTYMNFAPMTPGTRKTRQDALFSVPGKVGSPSAYPKGGISVSSTTSPGFSTSDQEVVIIWLGDTVVKIPNLTTFWEAQVRSNNSSRSTNSLLELTSHNRLSKLENVDLRREICCGVAHFPVPSRKSSSPAKIKDHHVATQKIAKSVYGNFEGELLITGEHRIIILSGIQPAETEIEDAQSLALVPADQTLAAMEDLDVNSMNRALEQMEEKDQRRGLIGKRKVGFLSPT